MTPASERLRELDGAIPRALVTERIRSEGWNPDWATPQKLEEVSRQIRLERYDATLPLIADVVEAAEREQARDLMLMAEGLPQNPITEDYERWRQSDEARARDYALTALREALEEK